MSSTCLRRAPLGSLFESSPVSTCLRLHVTRYPTYHRRISHAAAEPGNPTEAANPARKRAPALSKQNREYLDRALRVNHAGELAATLIYKAQTPVVTRSQPRLRRLMKHMHDQEAGHLATFEALLAKHRVRPTAMYPVWQVAATVLGWSTAVMGHRAAMACTEAVETEIGNHYNGQVRELLAIIRDMQAKGQDPGEELNGLVECIRKTRDEELEHLDHAVDNEAKQAEGHALLTSIVRGGCRTAIWISERI